MTPQPSAGGVIPMGVPQNGKHMVKRVKTHTDQGTDMRSRADSEAQYCYCLCSHTDFCTVRSTRVRCVLCLFYLLPELHQKQNIQIRSKMFHVELLQSMYGPYRTHVYCVRL